MSNTHPRIGSEIRVVSKMISLYCRGKHSREELCDSCTNLQREAEKRLSQCRHIENKPTCRKCTTGCWQKEHREKIREVMRYSGPRIIYRSPVQAFIHLLHEIPALRFIAFLGGGIALVAGAAGVIIPGLPTTPLILLSAFLFSQSSPKFHKWLHEHPRFGKIVKAWEEERAFPKGVKKKAVTLFFISILTSIAIIPVLHGKIVLGVVAIFMGIFLIRLPEQRSS